MLRPARRKARSIGIRETLNLVCRGGGWPAGIEGLFFAFLGGMMPPWGTTFYCKVLRTMMVSIVALPLWRPSQVSVRVIIFSSRGVTWGFKLSN